MRLGYLIQAERLLKESVRIAEDWLGERSMQSANYVAQLAVVYIQQKKYGQAEGLFQGRAAEVGAQTNRAILGSLANQEQRERFEEWQRLRAEREHLLLSTPTPDAPEQALRDARLRQLPRAIDGLEAELAAAAPRLRSMQVPAWESVIPQVAAKLPPRSVLVEIVRTQDLDILTGHGQRQAAHYIAMLLFPDGRTDVADLGEAKRVNQAVAAFLQNVREPLRNPQPASQALHALVMAPLEMQLAGATRIYLSLDGSLNLIPYSALHDGKQYLVDRFEFHYLTSGRDLLRDPARSAAGPLVLADPDFGSAAPEAAPLSARATERTIDQNTRGLYERISQLRRLPATRKEAQRIGSMLPGSQVRLDGNANERRSGRCALRASSTSPRPGCLWKMPRMPLVLSTRSSALCCCSIRRLQARLRPCASRESALRTL